MEIEMTKEEWEVKHKDFKTIIEGVKWVLHFIDGKGTCLVPVKIIKNEPKGENNET